jgi:HEAT repeat protein
MTRDPDAGVRGQALSTLAQIGGERGEQAVIDATRSGKTEDRVAAISGLVQMDDARSSQQLATLIRDADPQVATAAISSSYNAGAEVEQVLVQMVNDPQAKPDLQMLAASQLRSRSVDLDERTEQAVSKLVGSAEAYGGATYGYLEKRGYVDDDVYY